MAGDNKPSSEEDDLFEFETHLIVAWPGPQDPPPRTVRLPGMVVTCWPQKDGSVLYEIKYRNVKYEKKPKGRRPRDTAQMGVPWLQPKGGSEK